MRSTHPKSKATPVAVLASDLHLSLEAPACRAEKNNWLEVQAGYLEQVKQTLTDCDTDVFIVAGDVFDKWNSPPELINFAAKHLPQCYAVPGQHDLRNHQYKDLHCTAYWTLVETGNITNLEPQMPKCAGKTWLYGFPWDCPIKPCKDWDLHGGHLKVAIIHKYLWSFKEDAYPDAPGDLAQIAPLFRGYDVVLSGDNHKSFMVKRACSDTPTFYNPGAFMRRKADEIDHKPQVGILYSDGTIKQHYLDVSKDQFVQAPEAAASVGLGAEEFIRTLRELGDCGLDYQKAVLRYLDAQGVGSRVRELVLQALEQKRKS